MSRVWIVCKKIFSLALIFNALTTIACAVGIMAGGYLFYPDWKPFDPYLFDRNVFWIIIAAAAINIFPSALLGRGLHTGRFLFHHYFYGVLVLVSAVVYITAFTPLSVVSVFLVYNTSVAVNAGKFFLMGGLTLLIDDLPDVSKRVESALNWMKAGAYRMRKLIVAAQIVTGAFSLYLFAAICVAMTQVPQWVTLANFILIFTVLITGVTSFIFVKSKAWSSIMNNQENKH